MPPLIYLNMSRVSKEYDSCAVRAPRGEYETKVASYSIASAAFFPSPSERFSGCTAQYISDAAESVPGHD